MSVPVMSDGIRSGVNWMRRKLQAKRVRNGAHHQRLRRARHAGEQAVAADEQCNQHLVEHLVLAHDHLPHLADDVVAHRAKPLDLSLQLRRL